MKTDARIRQAVEEALRWTPDIKFGSIAVAAQDGAVMLHGAVARYLARFAAERAAMPILGVTGVVNAVELGVAVGKQRPDADIARDGVQLLARQLPLAELKIGVLVRSGWLTLDGEVDWFYQKELAEAAIRTVAGLQGIANTIEVRPKLNPDEIKHQIADAFRRGARADAAKIQVQTQDGGIVLTGTVRSWHERDQAESAAWAGPGVHRVDDRIVVRP